MKNKENRNRMHARKQKKSSAWSTIANAESRKDQRNVLRTGLERQKGNKNMEKGNKTMESTSGNPTDAIHNGINRPILPSLRPSRLDIGILKGF
jgi:hypothetical protein